MLRKRFFAAPTAAMLALALGLGGAVVATTAASAEDLTADAVVEAPVEQTALTTSTAETEPVADDVSSEKGAAVEAPVGEALVGPIVKEGVAPAVDTKTSAARSVTPVAPINCTVTDSSVLAGSTTFTVGPQNCTNPTEPISFSSYTLPNGSVHPLSEQVAVEHATEAGVRYGAGSYTLTLKGPLPCNWQTDLYWSPNGQNQPGAPHNHPPYTGSGMKKVWDYSERNVCPQPPADVTLNTVITSITTEDCASLKATTTTTTTNIERTFTYTLVKGVRVRGEGVDRVVSTSDDVKTRPLTENEVAKLECPPPALVVETESRETYDCKALTITTTKFTLTSGAWTYDAETGKWVQGEFGEWLPGESSTKALTHNQILKLECPPIGPDVETDVAIVPITTYDCTSLTATTVTTTTTTVRTWEYTLINAKWVQGEPVYAVSSVSTSETRPLTHDQILKLDCPPPKTIVLTGNWVVGGYDCDDTTTEARSVTTTTFSLVEGKWVGTPVTKTETRERDLTKAEIAALNCEQDIQLPSLPIGDSSSKPITPTVPISPVTPAATDLPTLAVTGANDLAGTVGLLALVITLTGVGMVAIRRRLEV